MPTLSIALEQSRPDQPFYSGSNLSGTLHITIDEPKNYKYVTVQFVGRADVHWTESHSTESTRHYNSTEVNVDLTQTLWSPAQSPDGRLPSGQRAFPFRFTIPRTAPSSFRGSVGLIEYTSLGRIGTGLFKFDHRIVAKIPVQQLVAVTDPHLQQPVRQELRKTLCCLCCASGPIVLTIALPKIGYCIRETFPLHVSIENGSSRRVYVNATISQKILYTAQGRHRHENNCLIRVTSDEIRPHITRDWDPTIEIPATEIIHENSCFIIKIRYFIVIAVNIPGALNLSTQIPLTLGNIHPQQQPTVPAAYPPNQPPAPFTPNRPSGPYPSNQPPAPYPPNQPPAPFTSNQPPPPYAPSYPPPPNIPGQPFANPPLAAPPTSFPEPAAIGWTPQPQLPPEKLPQGE